MGNESFILMTANLKSNAPINSKVQHPPRGNPPGI